MREQASLTETVAAFVRRQRLDRPRRMVGALLALMALRALFDALVTAFGGTPAPMFPDLADRYADLVKVALAYRDHTADIVAAGQWPQWPALFRGYLFSRDYDNALANLAAADAARPSLFHQSPLATLAYFGVNRAIALAGPVAVVAGYALGFAGCALLLARRFAARFGGEWWPVAALLACSFPALFMLTRGNFAGPVALLDMAYLLSLGRSGRARGAGWLALALAANLRPEPALLALMELTGAGDLRRRIAGVVVPGLITIAVGAGAFAAVHAIWPDYTLAHMRAGLALYQRLYVTGSMGDAWNVALAAPVKQAALVHGWQPQTVALAGRALLACGGLVMLRAGWLALGRRIDPAVLLFVLATVPVFVFPVHAYYHMVRYGPVLAWLSIAGNEQQAQARALPIGLLLLACSPLAGPVLLGPLAAVLLAAGCIAVLAVPQRRAAPVSRPACRPARERAEP